MNFIILHNESRGVSSYLKLGGQVVIDVPPLPGAFYSAKTWVGNCPLCPPAIYTTEKSSWTKRTPQMVLSELKRKKERWKKIWSRKSNFCSETSSRGQRNFSNLRGNQKLYTFDYVDFSSSRSFYLLKGLALIWSGIWCILLRNSYKLFMWRKQVVILGINIKHFMCLYTPARSLFK